jgi:ABC-2 type transport system ATP-binding protein
MLATTLLPTSGDAYIFGKSVLSQPHDVKPRIGYMSQAFSLYGDLTVAENLRFFAEVRGVPHRDLAARSARLLEFSGLTEFSKRQARYLSGGMKQKLALAATLISEPDLLFLDEPTSALDPIGRHDVREILIAERERGATVFLNSHLLSEVESVCDEVAVIDSGRLIESGRLADLLAGPCEVEITLAVPPDDAARAVIAELGGIVRAEGPGGFIVGLPAEDAIPVLVTRLAASGASIAGVVRRRRTLEALFLEAVEEAHRG